MAAGRIPTNLEFPELDKKEKARMQRAIEKLNREALKHEKAGEELLDMVSSHGPRVTAKTGDFSKKLYESGVISPQPYAPLARLPVEILTSVTVLLEKRADQVALALSCKRLAGLDSGYRYRLNSNGNPKVYSKPNKLEMLVRLRSWVPERYALCYNCLKFKPKNKAGWTTNMQITESGLASQRAVSEGPKCPKCADWLAIQCGKESVGYKRAAEKIKATAKRIKFETDRS